MSCKRDHLGDDEFPGWAEAWLCALICAILVLGLSLG